MSERSFKLAFGVQISTSKRNQLLADISAVVLGLKPALLIDCGLITASEFRSLLVDILKSLGLHLREVLKGFHIVKIYDDILLINLLAGDVLWSVECIPHYINIDKGLLSPCMLTVDTSQHAFIERTISKVYDKLTSVVSELQYQQTENNLDSKIISIVELDLLVRDFNLCTLFGRLLGYPLVYWFDINNGYTLDMIPLVRYSVKVKKNEESIATITEVAQQCTNLFLNVS